MGYNNGMKFTTFDKDNDKWSEGNCAASYGGAWWHKICSNVNSTVVNDIRVIN